MSNKDRVRREQEKKAARRERKAAEEAAEIEAATEAAVADVVARMDKLDFSQYDQSKFMKNMPLPRTELIGTMFKEEQTDEPGSWVACRSCGARFYEEGIGHSMASVDVIQIPIAVTPYGCPICGGHLLAEWHVINSDTGPGIAVSHPAFLGAALEMLLERLEAGEVTPGEALGEMRRTPGLSPLVQWIEKRGATANIVAAALIAVSGYFVATSQGDDAGLTPNQIEQIVEQVVDDLDKQPPPTEGPASQQEPSQPPPRTDHPNAHPG